MPVNMQPINSIIEAFLQASQQGSSEKNKQLDREQQTKLQEALFKQQSDLANREHEFRKAEFEKEMAEQKRQHMLNMYLQGIQLAASGQFQPQGQRIPGASETSSLPPFMQNERFGPTQYNLNPQGQVFGTTETGQINIPNRYVVTPEQHLERMRRAYQIQNEPKIALEQAKAQNELNLKILEQSQANARNTANIKSREGIASELNKTNLLRTRMMAAAHRSTANQVQANELADSAEMAALGLGDVPTGVNGIHVKSILNKAGLAPFTTKQSDALAGLKALDPLTQDMENFFHKYLEGSGTGGALMNSIAANVPLLPTNIKNDIGMIKGQAGQIAKLIGGEKGVLTERDITRAMGLLSSPGITSEQAQDRLSNFKQTINGRILGQVLGKYTPAQQRAILERHGYDINNFKAEINGTYKPIFATMKDGTPAYLNIKTGTYQSYQPLGAQ